MSREKRVIIDRVEKNGGKNQRVNLSSRWEKSTNDILLPMLRHSESLSLTSSSDGSTS